MKVGKSNPPKKSVQGPKIAPPGPAPSRSRTAPLNAQDISTLKASGVPATIGLSAFDQSSRAKKGHGTHEIQARRKIREAVGDDPQFLADLKGLKGKWDEKTRDGQKLSKTLVKLLDANPTHMPGMASGKDLVKSIVADLARPWSINQGDGTATCTTASLQIIMARSQPAEYARIAGELATTGNASLRDGAKIKIKPGDFEKSADRGPISTAFQESLYRLGSSIPDGAGTVPGAEKEGFGGRLLAATRQSFAGRAIKAVTATFGGTRLKSMSTSYAGRSAKATTTGFAGNGETGLTIAQFQKLNHLATGSNKVPVKPTLEVLNQMAMSEPRNVTLFLKPEKGGDVGHAVVIRNWNDGKAVIKDPEQEEPVKMSIQDLERRAEYVDHNPDRVSGNPAYLNSVMLMSALRS